MGGPDRGEFQGGQMVSVTGVLSRAWSARCKEARTERGDLRRAGVEIALRQPVCVGEGNIRVDQKLVFVKTPREAIRREANATRDRLGSRNEEGSVENLEIQEFEGHWVDVGAVASHSNATEGPPLPTELLAKHRSRAVVGQRRQEIAGKRVWAEAVNLARSLVRAEKES